MNTIALAMAVLVSSTAVAPASETSRNPVVSMRFNLDLPDSAPRADDAPHRLLNEQSRPVWRRTPWQAAQAAAPKRFNKTDQIIAVVAGVCSGWVAGGAIGFYATSDRDNPDDDTSGLRGMMIGAPIGAVIGAVVGYRLTK